MNAPDRRVCYDFYLSADEQIHEDQNIRTRNWPTFSVFNVIESILTRTTVTNVQGYVVIIFGDEKSKASHPYIHALLLYFERRLSRNSVLLVLSTCLGQSSHGHQTV